VRQIQVGLGKVENMSSFGRCLKDTYNPAQATPGPHGTYAAKFPKIPAPMTPLATQSIG